MWKEWVNLAAKEFIWGDQRDAYEIFCWRKEVAKNLKAVNLQDWMTGLNKMAIFDVRGQDPIWTIEPA